jgi:medium-chain acyl-[acyl-carrier-protein] hydrolase
VSSAVRTPWLARWGDVDGERGRLLCVPHVGSGAAVFRPWAAHLPAGVELSAVRLPGRESRLAEEPMTEMDAVVAALDEAVAPLLDRPFVLFGECSGSIVAFELARRLLERGGPVPVSLVVSACPAPQLPRDEPRLHEEPPDRLVAGLAELGGIDVALLADADLIQLLEPLLRADLRLIETWRHVPGPPLPIPITALGGHDDRFVGAAELEAWSEQTSERFRLRLLEANHFVARSAPGAAATAVAAELGAP